MIKYLFYFKIYIININQNCFFWICIGNFDLWLLWFFRVFQKMGIDNKGCVILLLILYLYVIVQMCVFLLMLNWVYVLLLFQKIDKWRLLFFIVFFFVYYIDFCVILYFFFIIMLCYVMIVILNFCFVFVFNVKFYVYMQKKRNK